MCVWMNSTCLWHTGIKELCVWAGLLVSELPVCWVCMTHSLACPPSALTPQRPYWDSLYCIDTHTLSFLSFSVRLSFSFSLFRSLSFFLSLFRTLFLRGSWTHCSTLLAFGFSLFYTQALTLTQILLAAIEILPCYCVCVCVCVSHHYILTLLQ